jgi:hypothetical protein
MPDHLSARKKQKLYQQWVENSGLPPESVPSEIEDGEELEATFLEQREGGFRWLGIRGGITLRLTLRHVLYLLGTSLGLLIITVCLIVIFIMRSCS